MFKPIDIKSPDIQALTLRLSIGSENKNLSVINVYDSPEHGSYKKRKKQGTEEYVSTMDSLMEFMVANKDLGEIYLTGDFNARTGSENHESVDTDDDDSFTRTLMIPVTQLPHIGQARTAYLIKEVRNF